jgi:hypothetical protein
VSYILVGWKLQKRSPIAMETYIREGMPGVTGGAKKILIALQKKDLARLDEVAQEEGRTRSDVVRHAVRHFLDSYFKEAPATVLASEASTDLQPACGGNGTE